AEQAREREQQMTSETPPNSSPGGSRAAIESQMRRGQVPEAYINAEWRHVRTQAVKEWSLTVAERTYRRSDPGARNGKFAGRGLLLLGPVGTGKSSAAALICADAVTADRKRA